MHGYENYIWSGYVLMLASLGINFILVWRGKAKMQQRLLRWYQDSE